MRELIKLNKVGNIEMTSRDIADWFDKRHDHVMRDIRNECKTCGIVVKKDNPYFGESYYMNGQNKKQPQYHLSKKGILLIGARYDARLRLALIEKIEELEMKIPKNNNSILQATHNLLFVVNDHDKKIIELDFKIENQITIDHGEQRKIKIAVNKRVIERLLGKQSEAYKNKSVRGLYYAAIYRTVYETFGVTSYRDIKRKDLEDCINLINAWIEPAKIKGEKVG